MISKYKSEQLLWVRKRVRTAANPLSGSELLQMLQLQKQGALHHQEKGYLHQATNSQSSCFGREQCFKWAKNSCKCFSYNCITKRREMLQLQLHQGYLHQVKLLWARAAANASCGPEQSAKSKIGGRALHKLRSHKENSCKSQSSFTSGPVQWACVPACCSVQFSAGGSLFLNERTGLHRKSVFYDE